VKSTTRNRQRNGAEDSDSGRILPLHPSGALRQDRAIRSNQKPFSPGSEFYVREQVHGHKIRKPKTEGFWFRFYPLRWQETTSM
jgi:hypothetical protein